MPRLPANLPWTVDPSAWAARIPEKEFLANVRDLADKLGWMNYHPFWSGKSPQGFPDLVLVRPPRVIFAELKSAKGVLTEQQRDWIDWLGRCRGVETYVFRPKDIAEIERILLL